MLAFSAFISEPFEAQTVLPDDNDWKVLRAGQIFRNAGAKSLTSTMLS